MKNFVKTKKNNLSRRNPFANLAEEIRSIKIQQATSTTENTPTFRFINVGTVLEIHLIFPEVWYNNAIQVYPRYLIQWIYDIPQIFEKHQYYISTQINQNHITGFFGFNSANDVNQAFEISGILNSYYQQWSTTLGDNKPGMKMVLEQNPKCCMSKMERNFFNTNNLNTNDFIFLQPTTNRWTELAFAQNAFYIQQELTNVLKNEYKQKLQKQFHQYFICTATTVLNENFNWK